MSSQIFSVGAPAWQDAKVQESAVADSELSQRSQAGCSGAKYVKLSLREPLGATGSMAALIPAYGLAAFMV